jgi:carbonic anhydrase
MKKALYIALGVQSLVLLGVLVVLGYTAFFGGAPQANPAPMAEATDEAPEEELTALPKSPPSTQEPEASDGGGLAPRDGGAEGGADGGADGGLAAVAEHSATGALSELVEGNQRFVQGVTRTRDVPALRRAPGAPLAVVIACSDAVVPVEQLFDQPLGALVVVRSPAHVIDAAAIAAVDDAVLRERVPVVLVLGHRGCPTVAAAIRSKARGEPALAAKVRAGLAGRPGLAPGPKLEATAAEANVSWAVGELTRSSRGLKAAKPSVLRTLYDEETGQVRWLDAEAAGEDQSARTHQ